tara:strand:+ start:1272 stop:1916 length:645 start_codon:yes stop_codon:yes gene_type:complete
MTDTDITEHEKAIYNKFLAVTRSSQNQPFKLRKDFSSFSENVNYVYLKKLGLFFSKFPNIVMDDFFAAPFHIYNDKSSYDLKFYTSQKALKIYTIYQTKKQNEMPDEPNQLFFIKQSLNFILKFCKENNITVSEYITHKTNNMNSFILHLKERKISIYVLFGFENAEKLLKSIGPETMDFMFKDLKNKLAIYRTRFYTSKKAKLLVKHGLEKIS